MMKKMNEQKKF